jgi:APA family basic amino acid/polyamine antiporter
MCVRAQYVNGFVHLPLHSLPVRVSARRCGNLLAVLGVAFGLAVTVGNTIGAGILRTPGTIAAQLPSFTPFIAVWIVGGVYALLGANALAELGTLLPRSGGQYVFVRRGLGDYAGFIVGWSDWISCCGSAAAVSIVVGEYASLFAPFRGSIVVIALLMLAATTFVQWRGIRAGGAAQNVTSLLKAIALLMLVAACATLGHRIPWTATHATTHGSLMLAFIVSLQAVIYTYDGWSSTVYFGEEIRDPGRNIPRAMFGGVLSVIAIYLLINVAFLRIVPLGSIAGQNLAAGVVAQAMFGPNGAAIIRVLTIVAMLSAVNSNVLEAPRVLFAMSRDGLGWRGAASVNAGGTPDVALLASAALAALFIVTDTFDTVIAKLAFFFVANYTLSFTTLFVLRRRDPDAPRPYRAWGHPWTTGLALAASIAFLAGAVYSDRESSLISLALLFLSAPVYLVIRRRKRT